jgi:hypothetical protein
LKAITRQTPVTDLPSTLQAIRESLPDPALIIFSAPAGDLSAVAGKIYSAFPRSSSMGVPGLGVVAMTCSDALVSLTVLGGDARIRCGIITDLDACPVADIMALERDLAALEPQADDTLCLEFCTGNEEQLVTVLNAVLAPYGLPLAGGSVFLTGDADLSQVACNGRVYEDASVYAFIRNLSGKIHVIRENIFRPVSETRYLATRVDAPQRRLLELDNRPAAEVYAEAVGIDAEALSALTYRHPFGRIVGTAIFTTSVRSIEADGSLFMYKMVNPNDSFYLLELMDYPAIFADTCRAIRELAPKPSLIFTIDCADRYRLYQDEAFMDDYLAGLKAIGPHSGVISGGEQFRRQHMNITMVAAVFE